MRPAPAFWLTFLFASSAQAQSWTCAVSEELSPNLPARMETLVDAQGRRTATNFYIHWVPRRGAVAFQIMAWTGIPSEATLLWKPERIEFSIPGGRLDRRGFVRIYGAGGLNLNIRPSAINSLRPTFDYVWVKIEDGQVIGQLWSHAPRRAEHVDRRGRTRGGVDIALPAAAEAQALFTRMRAALDRKARDPATQCTAVPEASEDDI